MSKQRVKKRPGHTVNAPPIILGGKRPGGELTSHPSVGDRAVSEASQRVLLHGNVGTCFAQQQQQLQNKVRRGQRTEHVLDVLPLRMVSRPLERAPC